MLTQIGPSLLLSSTLVDPERGHSQKDLFVLGIKEILLKTSVSFHEAPQIVFGLTCNTLSS